MKVIAATAAHGEIMAHIHRESYDQPWSAKTLISALSSPGAYALIGEDDTGEPLGFVVTRCGGGEAEILTLATRPSVRRTGVARALMGAALIRAQKAGAQIIFLEVAKDNHPAQALYAALDFSEVGHRSQYYERADATRVDAIVMKFSFF